MSPVELLLGELSEKGVDLWLEGDELRCRARKGVVTEEIRAELAAHKADILEILRERSRRPPAALLPKVVPDRERRLLPFPLSDMQQALWIGQYDPFDLGNVATNSYAEIELSGIDVEVERFDRAWQALVRRHDMLRAIILPDGQAQILDDVPQYEIAVQDLRGLDEAATAAALGEVRRTMCLQRYTLDRWPLFRIRASLLDGKRTRLHISLSLLISDAWSGQILARDLTQLYVDPDALRPLELSFRDYVLAKQSLKGSEAYDRALKYWRDRLPTLPPPPELPMVAPPGHDTTLMFVPLEARVLDAEAWTALKGRAAQDGLTPAVTLLAAFADVLAMWSKRPQFTLNAPFFDRLPLHPEVPAIIGSFTIPIHLEVDGRGRGTFVSRARELERQRWQDVEHSRYVSGIQVMRELAKTHRGTMRTNKHVVFNSVQLHAFSLAGFCEILYTVSQTPQVAIEVRMVEEGGALDCVWDVVEEVFPPGLLRDLFESYCGYLRNLATDGDVWRTEGRRHLIPAEHLELREAVVAGEPSFVEERLHAGFEARVRSAPEAPALVAPRARLSYAELDARAQELARWLRARGARPGALVAVVMEKGWEQVAATLGVLKAGAAFLPVDPDLPRERLWYMLENGDADLVLTQSWVDERLEWPARVQRLAVDRGVALVELSGSAPPAAREAQPGDLAYVIYTSGSTGVPKGVMISHRAAANTIRDVNRRFAVGPDDRVLALSSLSFDLSVYDLFGTLAAGGAIVFPDASGVRDPDHWVDVMRREGVTVWNSVPALMEMLVECATGRRERLPEALRLALLSGDWISPTLPERIRALSDRVEVVSLGGATEASIWSVAYPIEKPDPSWKSVPYGKPLAHQRLYVLDEDLEDRPLWVPGALYIGGCGLAEGYWRDQERTHASFVRHPRSGERLYRTGDWARYLPDGNIEFLGREDLQVKVGGYRIELGEIEAALQGHPSVRSALASAAGEERGERRLVAYVLPEEGEAVDPDALRRFLREKLPEYMVPGVYVQLDALPLTANGKIDRGALPAPDPSAGRSEASYVAPRTPLESQLAAVWAEVLGLERVGISDNFFDLSADSLQTVRAVSGIADVTGRQVAVRALFLHPTVADLARLLESQPAEQQEPEPRPLAAAPSRPRPAAAAGGTLRVEQRSLLSLCAAGKLAPVDAAVVTCIPESLFAGPGVDRGALERFFSDEFGDLPLVAEILDTQEGRLAVLTLPPRFSGSGAFRDPQALVGSIVEAVEIASRLGARVASLAALPAAATGNGLAAAEALERRPGLPRLTIGHPTTAAALALAAARIVSEAGRALPRERLAVLGLGPVGAAALRLILSCLPHPRSLLLCDPHGRRDGLEDLAREIEGELGFHGEVRLAEAHGEVPREIYDATLLVATTGAPDLLDLERVAPGTLIVDESSPPCFSSRLAFQRIQERADILFTQGGLLKARRPIGRLVYRPRIADRLVDRAVLDEVMEKPDLSGQHEITSCFLSGLLLSAFDHLEPSLGPADPRLCRQHYEALRQRGFEAASLQYDGRVVGAEHIAAFRERHATLDRDASAGRGGNAR